MRVAVALIAVPVAVADVYLAVLTVAAAIRQRLTRKVPVEPRPPRHRLAVLVPAHDEERIIGATIDSIVEQRYPRELFAVHVVADNCSDRTAEVARQHGAQVHERMAPEAPGKGPALGWLVERVQAGPEPVDAVVIIDADTSMSPDFLSVADAALDGDRSAWQAYYTVRDPEQTPATALRHAALALRHYVRPLGRSALGGSSGLFGNGMAFRTELLQERSFTAHLTEDVEFQLELLLDGQLVEFVPAMEVAAEMPASFAAARTQNERWELGRLQLARRFVPALVRRAVQPGVPERAAYVDAVLDQLVPPLSVLAAGTAAAVVAAGVLRGGGTRAGRAGAVLAGASALGLVVHVAGGLRVAGVPRSTYRALVHAPRLVVWKLALWLRVLVRPDDVSWTRTQRNES